MTTSRGASLGYYLLLGAPPKCIVNGSVVDALNEWGIGPAGLTSTATAGRRLLVVDRVALSAQIRECRSHSRDVPVSWPLALQGILNDAVYDERTPLDVAVDNIARSLCENCTPNAPAAQLAISPPIRIASPPTTAPRVLNEPWARVAVAVLHEGTNAILCGFSGGTFSNQVALHFSQQLKARHISCVCLEVLQPTPAEMFAMEAFFFVDVMDRVESIVILNAHLVSAAALDLFCDRLRASGISTCQLVLSCDAALLAAGSQLPLTECVNIRKQHFIHMQEPLPSAATALSSSDLNSLYQIFTHHLGACVEGFTSVEEFTRRRESLRSIITVCNAVTREAPSHLSPMLTMAPIRLLRYSPERKPTRIADTSHNLVFLQGTWTRTFFVSSIELKGRERQRALCTALQKATSEVGVSAVVLFETEYFDDESPTFPIFGLRAVLSQPAVNIEIATERLRAVLLVTVQVDLSIRLARPFEGIDEGVAGCIPPKFVETALKNSIESLATPEHQPWVAGDTFVVSHDANAVPLSEAQQDAARRDANSTIEASVGLGEVAYRAGSTVRQVPISAGTFGVCCGQLQTIWDCIPLPIVRVMSTSGHLGERLVVPRVNVRVGGNAASLGYAQSLLILPLRYSSSGLNLRDPFDSRCVQFGTHFEISMDSLIGKPGGGVQLYQTIMTAMRLNPVFGLAALKSTLDSFSRLTQQQLSEQISALLPAPKSDDECTARRLGFLTDDVGVVLERISRDASVDEPLLVGAKRCIVSRHPAAIKGVASVQPCLTRGFVGAENAPYEIWNTNISPEIRQHTLFEQCDSSHPRLTNAALNRKTTREGWFWRFVTSWFP